MFDIIGIDSMSLQRNNGSYTLEKFGPIDLTDQNDGVPTTLTHRLTGFEEDLYLIQEPTSDGGCFYFAYQVGDTRLFVGLQDKEIQDQAVQVVFDMVMSNE